MDNAYTNKGTRSLYTLKSDKPMFKSRMKKEKENSNIISQTLDLKTYDELISKTKENIMKFKKDFKEKPNITFINTSAANFKKSNSQNALKSVQIPKEVNNNVDRNIDDEIKITPYKTKKIQAKMMKNEQEFPQEKYYKAVIESMKKDLLKEKEKVSELQNSNNALKEENEKYEYIVNESNIEKENLTKRLNSAINTNKDIFEILSDIKEQKKYIEESMTNLQTEYQSEVEKIRKEIKTFEKGSKGKKEKDDYETTKNELNKIMKENLKIKFDSHNYRKKIYELEKENKELNDTLLKLKLTSTKDDDKDLIDRIKKENELIMKEKENTILELKNKREEIDIELKTIKENYCAINLQNKKLIQEKEDMLVEINSLKNQLSEISLSQRSNEDIQTKYYNLQVDYSTLTTEKKLIEQQKNELLLSNEKLKDESKEAENIIQELKNTLEINKDIQNKYELLQKDILDKDNKIAQLANINSDTQAEKESLIKEKDELKQKIKEIEEDKIKKWKVIEILQKDKENNANSVNTLKDEMQTKNNEIENLKKEIGKISEERDSELLQCKEQIKQIENKFNTQCEELIAKNEELTKEIKQLNDNNKKEQNSLQTKLEALTTQYNIEKEDNTQTINDLESKIKQFKEEIELLSTENSSKEKTIKELQLEITSKENSENETSELSNKLSEYQSQIESLTNTNKDLIQNIQIEKEKTKVQFDLNTSLNNEIVSLNKEKTSLSESIKKLNNDISILKENNHTLNTSNESLQTKIITLESEKNVLKDEIAKSKSSQTQSKANILKNRNELLMKEIANQTKEIANLKKENEDLLVYKEDYESLKLSYDELKLSSLENKVNQATEKEIKDLQSTIEELKKHNETLENEQGDYIKQIEALQNYIDQVHEENGTLTEVNKLKKVLVDKNDIIKSLQNQIDTYEEETDLIIENETPLEMLNQIEHLVNEVKVLKGKINDIITFNKRITKFDELIKVLEKIKNKSLNEEEIKEAYEKLNYLIDIYQKNNEKIKNKIILEVHDSQ